MRLLRRERTAALGALSYYTLETNAVLVDEAQRWLAEVLAESL